MKQMTYDSVILKIPAKKMWEISNNRMFMNCKHVLFIRLGYEKNSTNQPTIQ